MSKVAQATVALSSNTRLVQECLAGNEAAWSALIDKHKNLIFSVPIKYGLSRDEAADIFQAVCLDLLTELSKLRNPEALPAWLISAARHRCLHSTRKRLSLLVGPQENARLESRTTDFPEQAVRQVERIQMLHQALSELPRRCRQLVQMLFFENPARPYSEICGILGVARGSIGFIRGRCLKRLRRRLEMVGFDRE